MPLTTPAGAGRQVGTDGWKLIHHRLGDSRRSGNRAGHATVSSAAAMSSSQRMRAPALAIKTDGLLQREGTTMEHPSAPPTTLHAGCAATAASGRRRRRPNPPGTHHAASKHAPGRPGAAPSHPPASGTPRRSRGSPPPGCKQAGRRARAGEVLSEGRGGGASNNARQAKHGDGSEDSAQRRRPQRRGDGHP